VLSTHTTIGGVGQSAHGAGLSATRGLFPRPVLRPFWGPTCASAESALHAPDGNCWKHCKQSYVGGSERSATKRPPDPRRYTWPLERSSQSRPSGACKWIRWTDPGPDRGTRKWARRSSIL